MARRKVGRARQRSATPIDVYVGVKIRARRQALSLTQEQLGEKLGVSFQQVQKYEKGMNRVGASRLVPLAKALDVEVGWFFEGAPGIGGPTKKQDEMMAFMKDPLAFRIVAGFPGLPMDIKRQVVRLVESATAH